MEVPGPIIGWRQDDSSTSFDGSEDSRSQDDSDSSSGSDQWKQITKIKDTTFQVAIIKTVMPIGWKCLGQLRILFCIISNPTDQIIGWRQEDGSGSSTSSTSTSSDYDSEDSSSEDETVIIVQRPNLIKDTSSSELGQGCLQEFGAVRYNKLMPWRTSEHHPQRGR